MRGRRIKKIIALGLCILLSIAASLNVSAKTFEPRTTKPTEDNRFFYDSNPFYQGGYGLANCTCYAYGRAYEVRGIRPLLSTGDASSFYMYNIINDYYAYGQIPKPGAVGCFKGGSSGEGHVIFVESVNEDGTVNISESNWHGRQYPQYAFRYLTGINPHTFWPHLTFQGYIYVATEDSEEPVGITGVAVNEPGVNQNTKKHPGNALLNLKAGVTMGIPLKFD